MLCLLSELYSTIDGLNANFGIGSSLKFDEYTKIVTLYTHP